MSGQTTTAVGLKGLLALLLLAAPGAAQERQPERPLLLRASEAERAQILLPTFCRTDPAEVKAGEGHPKFGMPWCRLLALEGPGEEGIDGERRKVEALLQFGTPFQPFCREGGGHPRFGAAWCQRKTQSLLAGQAFQGGAPAAAPDPAHDVAPFCRPGGAGHPKWGIEWCSMSEEERDRLGRGNGGDARQEDEDR